MAGLRAPVFEGKPGASALREYEQRRLRRKQQARKKLGLVGVALTYVIADPQHTQAWRKGAEGEIKSARRLAKHLEGRGVRMLHDRRVPGRARANIDHILIGPGGVTVVDSKVLTGRVRTGRRGGLFSSRPVLLIDGRDRTALVKSVQDQIGYAQGMLKMTAFEGLDVRGALCFPYVDGLPVFQTLWVDGVMIDGPKRVAKLARRKGQLDDVDVERVWRHLDRCFPQA